MSKEKPSIKRVLQAYSWDASLIGVEADGPIEYPPDEKRIYAPVEDGVPAANFSGQIFRELSDRQTAGELGSEPNLRERPATPGKGMNFSLENDKKYKIGSAYRVAAIKRVADRYLTSAKFLTPPINSPQSELVALILHKVEVEREYNTPWYWVEVDGVNESWITKSLSKLSDFGFDFTYTLSQRGSIRLEWRQPDSVLQRGEGADRREFQGWVRKMEKAVRDQIKVINREIKGGRKTNVKRQG